MRIASLLALGLALVGVWPQDGARGQTSLAPPVIGGLAPPPNPGADYDGFSAGLGNDDEAPSQMVPPARSRAATGAKPDPNTAGISGQRSFDQEDDALKRKLTICKSCK
ncbi:hypothetical protein ACU4GH_16025 [Bradyrhizobium betae]